MRKIGLHIKDLRRSKNMTQQELATQLGYTKAYISNVERGADSLSIEQADQILKFFGKRTTIGIEDIS